MILGFMECGCCCRRKKAFQPSRANSTAAVFANLPKSPLEYNGRATRWRLEGVVVLGEENSV